MKYYKCDNCGRKTTYYRKYENDYKCHRCGNTFSDITPKNNIKISESEIIKNLVLAEIGRPLTIPLSTLNRNCEFNKEWNKIQKKWHKRKIICKNCGKEFNVRVGASTYCSPECRKAYYQRPEVKAYRERPEVKAKNKVQQKAYYQRPEVKARKKAYYIKKKKVENVVG